MTDSSDLKSLRIDDGHKKVRTGAGRRFWIALVVVALLVVAVVALFLNSRKHIFRVYLMPVSASRSGGPAAGLNATGYLVAKDPISISPEVSGRVIAVGPEVGERVESGQLLIAIDSTFYHADWGATDARYRELLSGSRPEERRRTRAQRDEAVTQLARAESDHARAEKLFAEGAVSRSSLENLARDRDAARARLEAADEAWKLLEAGARRETIEEARNRSASSRALLERCLVRSPISGVIVQRAVTAGGYVIAGQGVGLRDAATPPPYIIADLSRMEAIVEVSERELQKVSVGMPALVRPDALPDSIFTGVVDRITPFAYRQKGTIELRLRIIDPSPLMKHEMNARIEFVSDTRAALTTVDPRIPSEAIRSDDRGSFVLVLEADGKVVRRDVESSPADNGLVNIESGLLGGERIVLDAGARDGDRGEASQDAR